ncbi:DUF7935 family protein [Cnuella takakiae]|nr:hypothetical protein [Cnuella takakiae]OLY93037.1 hypothetical protein BUE76_14880 [Cnuella takakiae]
MDTPIIAILIAVVALVISLTAFLTARKAAAKPAPVPTEKYDATPLQLQAYERLVLLAERISLPNLVSRLNIPGASAPEMQAVLLDNIRQEYEYNASQQVYVSAAAWDAIRNLRDQNMLIINQIASILPADARGSDLSKQVLEVVMAQQEKALHTIVLDALNFEAKKLMR